MRGRSPERFWSGRGNAATLSLPAAAANRKMGLSNPELIQQLMAQRAMLLGYISLLVGDPHLTEDVFQEVAVVVLEKGHSLESPQAFPAWARRIAQFKAIHALRQKSPATKPLNETLLETLAGDWRDHESGVPASDSKALEQCLAELSPHARKMIELRYYESLSGEALSGRLGKPLNTVYVSLTRIYRRLLECMRLRRQQEGLACE